MERRWASEQEAGLRMFYDEMQVTVDRAAALLPDPPQPGDPEGYARWEALTLDTGRLLARVLDADIGQLRALMEDDRVTPVGCRPRRRLLLRVALLDVCKSDRELLVKREAPQQRPAILRPIAEQRVKAQSRDL